MDCDCLRSRPSRSCSLPFDECQVPAQPGLLIPTSTPCPTLCIPKNVVYVDPLNLPESTWRRLQHACALHISCPVRAYHASTDSDRDSGDQEHRDPGRVPARADRHAGCAVDELVTTGVLRGVLPRFRIPCSGAEST